MKRLLAFVLLASLASATSAAAATISGAVRDAATSGGLASMNVDAYTTTGTRVGGTVTTATGAYTLNLPAGSYRLLAYDLAGTYATSFYADAESFETATTLVLAATQTMTASLALQRAGWIAGVVTGASAPLPNATVTVYNESGTTRGWTRTDATGSFRVAVPAGSFRIAAWDDAGTYLARFNGGAKTFATATDVAVTTASETRVDLALPLASFVTGTVVDAVTNAPLGGMVVDAWKIDGTYAGWVQTAPNGTHRLALESGAYRLVFSDPAGVYAPAYLDGASSFASSAPIVLGSGETRTHIDAQLTRGGRLRGRVVDARSGAALAGISVAAWNADGTARTIVKTNEWGDYVLVVPPGVFRIGAWDDLLRYSARFRFDTPLFGQAATVTVVAGDTLSGLDVALPPVVSSRRRAAAH